MDFKLQLLFDHSNKYPAV